MLRPRVLFLVFRSRAPLALQLLFAQAEDRLLWRSPEAFLLIEAPGTAKTRRRGRARWLHWLDRGWEWAVLAVPALLLEGVAVVVFSFGSSRLTALLLLLGSVLWIAVLMAVYLLGLAWSTVRSLRSGRSRAVKKVTDAYRYANWSIGVCHVNDPEAVPALLDEALERVREIVGGDDREYKVLVCPPTAITSSSGRSAVLKSKYVRSFDEDGWGLALVRAPGQSESKPDLPQPRNHVVPVVVSAVVLMLVSARMITDHEVEACLSVCTGGPTTYLDTVFWLFRHYIVVGVPGAQSASKRATVLALMTTLIGLATAVYVVQVARHDTEETREEKDELAAKITPEVSRVLVLIANEVERDEVIAAVGNEVTPVRRKHHTVFDLGLVSRTHLQVARTGQGVDGAGAATLTTATLIDDLKPDVVMMVGICYGLRETKQQLGDVIISERLRAVNWRKETSDRTIVRGELVMATSWIIDRCHAATYGWQGRSPDFGLLLSESVLVDSAEHRAKLLDLEPEARGGETEMAGVYGACAKNKVDWVAIKGISDWGMGKTDGHQREAAKNAAEFMAHLLRTGGLDPVD